MLRIESLIKRGVASGLITIAEASVIEHSVLHVAMHMTADEKLKFEKRYGCGEVRRARKLVGIQRHDN